MRLYIHIPFCASKCSYCAFASVTNKDLLRQYFDALCMDLRRFLPLKKSLKSIYFGGGTPSFVAACNYRELFALLKPFITSSTEISAEANPNSLSLKWLNEMRDFGLNRLSLGVQSFNDKKLRFLNRSHSSELALKKIKLLQNEKINYSIDIIYGTFLDDLAMLNAELETIKSLQLQHLSAYTLILENDTPFAKKYEYLQLNDELNCYFYEKINELGLKAYEISNFASEARFECSHNKAYWDKQDYIGIGLSSVGTTANKRYYANKDLALYIKEPQARLKEILSKDNIRLESIFLGLRSNVGVSLDLIKDIKKLDDLKDFIYIKDKRLFNKNYLLSDEIALYLE